jgi:hypothetical protein
MRYNAKFLFYFNKLSKRIKIGTNRALYRAAGLIRTAERRTIRVRPGASRPDHPPHAHTSGGIRAIEFHVFGNSAIIGPKKFPGSKWWNEPVPHMHEFGGVFINRKGKTARYPERSFAATTLKRLQSKNVIPRQFAVSIAEML